MTGFPFSDTLLTGKTALITGASSGIGAACAAAFNAAGADLILSGRDQAKLEAVAAPLRNATLIATDLAKSGEPERLAQAAEAVAPVDILVASAGAGVTKRSSRLSEAEIDEMFALNARGMIVLAGRLAEKMAGRDGGSIVTLSSVVASLGTPFQTGYAASKGAVEAATRSLAREFGPSGVRVNAIAPGLIANEMWGDRIDNPDILGPAADRVTLRRWGDSNTVAMAALFLASDAASYITGHLLAVDGGLFRTGDLLPRELFGGPKK